MAKTKTKNIGTKQFAAPQPSAFTAQGTEDTPADIFQELGANTILLKQRDYVPELANRFLALRTYEHMIRNDAQVRAIIRACKVPVLSGQWYVDPASDDQVDKDAAEFVQYNLENMNTTWSQFLEEALHFIEYGFSVFEQVYDLGVWAPLGDSRKSRNYAMLRKLAPRPQSTIMRFKYDDSGGPDGVYHVKIDPNRDVLNTLPGTPSPLNTTPAKPDEVVFIPIEKLVVFTFDKQGGDLEGLSLLRSVYKHWYIKENLYKIDAVQKERHSLGVPKATLPPGASKADRRTAANMLRNIRTNEDAFILEPPGWVVDFAEIKGHVVDPMRSIEHHDMMIARAILVQFIVHNSTAGGANRASGATEYDLYLKALRHVANIVADIINSYVIPRLIDYNFQVKRYPRLRVRRIGDNRDLQQLSAAIRNLVDCAAIIPDNALEEWLRDELEAPDMDALDNTINESDDPRELIRLRKLVSAQVQLDPSEQQPNGNQPTPNGNGKTGRPNTGRTGKAGVVPNK